MKSILVIIAAGAIQFAGCKQREGYQDNLSVEDMPKPTPEALVEDLIKRDLLRVDINFFQARSSPEFKGDDNVHWSDSEISCQLDLNNYSKEDLWLEQELFTHYDWIQILRISDGKEVASLSAHPPRGVMPPKYFKLPAESSRTFGIQYESFECFHGTRTSEGAVHYIFPGDFVIFHKRFPDDRLEFSVDESGIVRPKLDMKIQDGTALRSPNKAVEATR